MSPQKVLVLLILLLSFSATLNAQDKDEDVLRIDTQLVEVPVVVTDKAGKPLVNLKQSNFEIYEDGKRQELVEFGATSAPFEVALLLDTSGSTRSDLGLIKRAAENFINSLRPGDRVSIIAFNTVRDGGRAHAESEILIELTDNREKLKNALEKVQTSNGTPYYDAVLKIVNKVFREKPKEEFRGRRALVALTDGLDSVSESDFEEVREELSESGLITFFVKVNTQEFFEENLLGDCEHAMRFSIAQIRRYYRTFYRNANVEKVYDFCKLGDFERLDISRKLYQLADLEMQQLVKVSGGKIFPAADFTEARNAFRQVAGEIGTNYSLGYYSTNEKRDGTYRKIEVKVKNIPAGAVIRAREGYTAPKN
jgi:Ca-activated chloride channel family protein